MLFRCCLLWMGLCLVITQRVGAQYEDYRPGNDTADINRMIDTAKAYVYVRKLDSAHTLFRTIFQISRQIRYHTGITRSLNGLGNVEAELGNFHKSVHYLKQAIQFARQLPDSGQSLPFLYNNLASTYANWGNQDEALKHYGMTIAASEQHPEAAFPAEAIYTNVGYLLNHAGRYDEALFYLQKGITRAWHSGNFAVQALLYTHIGDAYQGKQIWDSAATYYKLALAEARIIKAKYTRHLAYKGLADLALHRNQPELAIYYLKQAATSGLPLHPDHASEAAVTLGIAYSKTGNPELAHYYLQHALEVSRSTGLLQNMMEAHMRLAGLYAARSDYDSAYYHQQQVSIISDSIHNYNQTRNAQHLEARFRSAIKDKEIKEKQLIIELKEQELNTRNIWMGIIISGLLTACAIIFLLRKYYRNKQALKDANMRQMLRQQQLNEFRAILQTEEKERNRIARDLHDGVMIQFSVVKMNLSALAGKPDRYIEKEQLLPHIEQLNTATQTLRNVAHHLMPDMLLEGGLAEALYYFCKSLQAELPFHLKYEQMDEIPRFDIQIEIAIYRIVQELVQNIIKHAEATHALVQISYNDDHLGIEVEDNGKGMDTNTSHKGMGLKNIATRVKHLNGQMHISSGDSGTSISLEFNLKQLDQTVPEKLSQIT